MAGRRRSALPAALSRGRNRFDAWRQTRQPGARIPRKLWTLAVGLAEEHGISRTAFALKLDYNALKKRVETKSSGSADVAEAFVEVAPPSLPVSGECVIEFEDGTGACLRVRLRGCHAPDLMALGRSFWSEG